MNGDNPIKAEAMTLTQLAQHYKVCARTVKKWLQPFITEIGKPEKTYLFTPEQVRKIFERIGEP